MNIFWYNNNDFSRYLFKLLIRLISIYNVVVGIDCMI